MSVARVLFLAKYRVPHACFALQFDQYLEGIDRTVISSPVPKEELWPVFERYNIDTSNFDYLPDSIVFEKNPEIENWVIPGDYRGWWLRQQAIKLAVLDTLDYKVMLMHDPDTFMISPYRCYDPETNKLTFTAIKDTTHSEGYYKTLENALGFSRQTGHCFITELVPCFKEDITALKQELESRHNCHWLDAIINNVPDTPTVPPWGNGETIKWFSEYEFIGNWTMRRRDIDFVFQHRFEYDSMDKLSGITHEYNAVCDAVPDLSLSMQMDWDTLTIPNFENYLQAVNERQHTI